MAEMALRFPHERELQHTQSQPWKWSLEMSAKRGREQEEEHEPPARAALRLCSPNRATWQRAFAAHFGGATGGAHAPAAQSDAAGADRPSRVLLLGPAHFPLRSVGSALVRQTKDALDLRVHTASALPLAPHSALPREDLSYVVFVVDMSDLSSLALFREASAHIAAVSLQRCGVVLVYGAEDASTHAFALPELVETAGVLGVSARPTCALSRGGTRTDVGAPTLFAHSAEQRAVQLLFLSAPRPGAGTGAAARAGAERLATLFRADGVGRGAGPGSQVLLRIRSLQASLV